MAWLSTAQTAHRLGVKPATIYAYVSRGVLHNHHDPDTRRSRFDEAEVERLAVRGRPREASRVRSLDLQIETAITEIDGHRVRYRGHEQAVLARAATFEQVAELIWTGELPDTSPVWASSPIAVPAGEMRLFERLRVIVALDAVGQGSATDTSSFVDTGRRLVATLIDSIPLAGGDGRIPRLQIEARTPLANTMAGRLWPRLTRRRASPALLRVLNASMVMLADHEIAASTLAARVAASTRGSVHDVVTAGFGALGGPLHGGESRRVRGIVSRAAVGSVRQMVDDALGRYGRLPGFGQVLYPDGDPRAVVLLDMLRSAGQHPSLDVVDALIDEAACRRLPPPNVDLALAALGAVADMPSDAGTAIFGPARVVGWVAHALEEQAEPALRFRPRAVYVGPSRRT